MNKKKILFITNIPSPYRVDFFNELGKYSDLTVLFERSTSSERDKSWKEFDFQCFNGIILKGIRFSVDSAFCPSILFYLSQTWDKIIVCNFTTPTGILAIRYLKRKKIPYWLEADGGFAKNGHGYKEFLKRWIITGADGYLSTGTYCDGYFKKYGAKESCIHRYYLSSIHESEILNHSLTYSEKSKIRKKLRITENIVIVSVGQFIHRKGLDILLKAVKELPLSFGVYIIGGCPTKQYLNLIAEHKGKNIHFVEFKNHNDLVEYYKSADLFVLPTREDIWGLVIVEALACGLPVIATERCGSAKELIVNKKNGFIIPTEDTEMLKEKIMSSLINKDEMLSMREESLRSVHLFSIENMVETHKKILKL